MEKVTIELEAKTQNAIKELEEVRAELKGLQEQMGEASSKGGKGISKLGKIFKVLKAPLKGVTKGFKLFGKALTGLGVVGLLTKGFEYLSELFQKNQKVADLFATASEAVSIIFNDLVNLIVSSAKPVQEFFKALFENPKKTMKEFASTLQQAIINRFVQLKETLGFVAKGIGELFKGNFSEAMDSFKQAGKEAIDVYTGVDGSFEKVKKAVTSYAKETVKTAKAIVELNKQAELSDAINQGLIEKYDIQAESLRQIRDDESKTISERIAANNELAEVLDEQEKVMKANAQTRLQLAELELRKNKDNIEAQVALIEAQNELAAIEAQVTGFRSEQQTNVNSLLKEEQDARRELAEIGKTEAELERLEALNIYNDRKQLIERTISDEAERAEALKKIKGDYDAYIRSADRVAAEEQKKIAEDTQKAKLDTLQNGLAGIAANLGKETAAGKAAAISSALISTYQSATDSYKSLSGIPIVGPALGFAAAAAAVGAGMANVKAITSTKTPNTAGMGGGTPSISAPSTPRPQPPAFNIVGASAGNQLAETIAGQNERPIKAFVTSQDVTTAQSLERNIVEGASI
tara:strand:+ start:1117 stop:2853 length:1737 start_codon:yes stop_codon:yes gene_type:complete